jgi:hypothetical protein
MIQLSTKQINSDAVLERKPKNVAKKTTQALEAGFEVQLYS